MHRMHVVHLTVLAQIPSGHILPHKHSPRLILARIMPRRASPRRSPHIHNHTAPQSPPRRTIPHKPRRWRSLAHTRLVGAVMVTAPRPPCPIPGRVPTREATSHTLVKS